MTKRTAPVATAPLRAAIYCRISQDQTGEQLGVTRQQEDCVALVEGLGWTIAGIYSDNDISASSGATRPQYEAMLKAVRARQVDAVVAWAPDRLYRKLRDLEPLIEALEQNSTVLRTVRGGEFDMATPLGRMIARILASVATGEGEVKSDRWKRSVRQRREAGIMPGSGPRMKGWTRDGQVIEDEAEEIRWMTQQIVDGMSARAMATAARDRGIRSTQGNVMAVASVKRLLLNPRLAGYSTLNGEIVGTGTWEPILDTETWETVRALLTAGGTRTPPPRVASLAGLIWCGHCGSRMVSGSRMAKKGGTSRTYRCTRNVEGGGCMKVSMNAHVIEEVVESYARERLADPRIRARIEGLRAVPKSELAEVTALQARLVELEHQLDDPGISVKALLGAIERTKTRIGSLSEIIARAPTAVLPGRGAPWPTDVPTRRNLIGLVVERVVIQPSTTPGIVDLERIEIEPRG